jgi:hypothetical protein
LVCLMGEGESIKPTDKETVIKAFKVGGTIILLLLLLMASFGFYFSMQSAIGDIFDNPYVELMRSIFNLCLIVAILYIIKVFIIRK